MTQIVRYDEPYQYISRSTLVHLRPALFAIIVLFAVEAFSQASQSPAQPWTVRPEWIHAHEAFLASDALGGRGSATPDEQIAATYVASQFESYGLQRAPGMPAFIQAAGIEVAQLDGHANLTAGKTALAEGRDFDLLFSTGNPSSGPLSRLDIIDVKTVKLPEGSVILLGGITSSGAVLQAVTQLARNNPALILIAYNSALDDVYSMMGSRTRTPIHLAGEPAQSHYGNIVLLRNFAKLPSDGSTVSINMHPLPPTERRTYNAIGYLPGTDPQAGTILISAHLDHLGTGRPVHGDGIYNGANDDAAGTTAVLELAHALAAGPRTKRSILFACYGSEEIGLLGSRYFGQHMPIPLTNIIVNIEFEMLGYQDPQMPKGELSLTGWERSNLGPALKAQGALIGPDHYREEHFFERSDNYSMALQGVVAHTAVGWGKPPNYHQPDDDIEHIDFAFMTAAIQSLVEPLRWLASSDFRPQWNPGGQPKRGN